MTAETRCGIRSARWLAALLLALAADGGAHSQSVKILFRPAPVRAAFGAPVGLTEPVMVDGSKPELREPETRPPEAGPPESGPPEAGPPEVRPPEVLPPEVLPPEVSLPELPDVPLLPVQGLDELAEKRLLQKRLRDADAAQEPQLTPPGVGMLFRRESEGSSRERIRQEAIAARDPLKAQFPEALGTARAPGQDWRPGDLFTRMVEPNYLCYDRLFFQQVAAERYGHSLGPLHPVWSAGRFYYQVFAMPLELALPPWLCHECSGGPWQ